MQVAHRTAFNNFDATFSPDVTKEFWDMVVAWDKDKDQPNPYEEPVPCKLSHLFISESTANVIISNYLDRRACRTHQGRGYGCP